MKVKELIERLKECEQDSLIQFYFLKDYDLTNCLPSLLFGMLLNI